MSGAGPLAQSAEQRTFNPWVQGSIPWRPTTPCLRAAQLFRVPSALVTSALRAVPMTTHVDDGKFSPAPRVPFMAVFVWQTLANTTGVSEHRPTLMSSPP